MPPARHPLTHHALLFRSRAASRRFGFTSRRGPFAPRLLFKDLTLWDVAIKSVGSNATEFLAQRFPDPHKHPRQEFGILRWRQNPPFPEIAGIHSLEGLPASVGGGPNEEKQP